MRAKKLLSDLEAGGEHARLKVEANRTGAELLQLEAFVNANFKSAPPPAWARHAYASTRVLGCSGRLSRALTWPSVWPTLEGAFMKIIKRHDDVSEQKYRALFVPKLKAQPFFNERHPPMRS